MILELVRYYCSVELELCLNLVSKFGAFSCPPDKVSLCVPDCPGSHSVDHADLELRNLSASAKGVGHHCPADISIFKKPLKGTMIEEIERTLNPCVISQWSILLTLNTFQTPQNFL